MIGHVDSLYGSDRNGLVWAYVFHPDKPAEEVSSQNILSCLKNITDGNQDGFLWLHFSLSNSASKFWLKRHLNLPETFFESVTGEPGSTRIEQENESLVAVIHDVQFDFTYDTSGISLGSLYIDANLAISARLRPLRSLDALRNQIRKGRELRSPTALLAELLQQQAAVLTEVLRKSTWRLDHIEDQLLANRISFSRSELGNLRRTLVRLQRLLAPEPAAFFRLLNRPPSWITDDDLKEMQQAAEEFSVAVGDSVALIERAKLLQEELLALLNEQTNRTLYVLTLVTVLALPINLVAGLFGMNVGGMPLANNHLGFFIVVSLLLGLTATLAHLAWRNRD